MGNSFDTMRKAIDQVERNNQNYHDDCFLFAVSWVKTQFKSFTSEDLKQAYYDAGNDKPREARIFGSIFNKLSKGGLIFKLGWEYSKNPICHARPVRNWISLEYRNKQKSNAVRNKNQIPLKL